MNILRDVKVAEKLGLSRATVWRKAKEDPEFPKSIRLSTAITGWIESEVDDYLARKVAQHRHDPSVRRGAIVAAEASSEKRAKDRISRSVLSKGANRE